MYFNIILKIILPIKMDKLYELHRLYYDTLPLETKLFLVFYAGEGYMMMNAFLRGQDWRKAYDEIASHPRGPYIWPIKIFFPDRNNTESIEYILNYMCNIITRAIYEAPKNSEKFVVARATGKNRCEKTKCVIDGFLSTSNERDAVFKFFVDKKEIAYEAYEIKPGSKFLILPIYNDEHEILFPHGCVFDYVNRKKIKLNSSLLEKYNIDEKAIENMYTYFMTGPVSYLPLFKTPPAPGNVLLDYLDKLNIDSSSKCIRKLGNVTTYKHILEVAKKANRTITLPPGFNYLLQDIETLFKGWIFPPYLTIEYSSPSPSRAREASPSRTEGSTSNASPRIVWEKERRTCRCTTK